jgi:hypothetical protein
MYTQKSVPAINNRGYVTQRRRAAEKNRDGINNECRILNYDDRSAKKSSFRKEAAFLESMLKY